jgi:hypothetical protein
VKFTEREMTVGVEAVARTLYAGTRPPWKRGDADSVWADLDRAARYRHLAAAGELVLPALVALPERPTVGATPSFSSDEYAEAAEAGSRALMEQRRPGSWDQLSDRRRKRVNRATEAMTRVAVQAMPFRQDPDALVVPDHL